MNLSLVIRIKRIGILHQLGCLLLRQSHPFQTLRCIAGVWQGHIGPEVVCRQSIVHF
ncbi:unnamed protein product [Penicillium olsonii]|nr:unnamed protein product [Penicillium olsonii]